MNMKKTRKLAASLFLSGFALTAMANVDNNSSNIHKVEESGVKTFLNNMIGKSPMVKQANFKIIYHKKVNDEWEKDVVKGDITLIINKKVEPYFAVYTNGKYFTEKLYDKNGKIVQGKDDIKLAYNENELVYKPSKIKNIVVIFSDFQCPFCNKNGYKKMQELKNKGDTAIYFYNFPLTQIHPNSKNASLCYIAAIKKYPNKKFEILSTIFKKKLFDMKKGEEKKTLDEIIKFFNKNIPFAKISKEDIKKYKAEDILEKEIALGYFLDVKGTPTVFLNGNKQIKK